MDQEEEISHNNIKKVSCLQKYTKGQFNFSNFKILKQKSSVVSYDEEDEDSDIFGESDRDNEEDVEDNTEVRPHLTLYLLRKPEIILNLMDFTPQIQNTGSSSFAEELAARIKGDVVIKAEGDRACKLLTLKINMPFPSLLRVILARSLSLCFCHVLPGKH